MSKNVLLVQKRLKELGYSVGPLDGVRGRRLISAVKQFQNKNGLTPDGLVGRNTYATMFSKRNVVQPKIPLDEYPWLAQAYSVMGLHETHNKSKLMSWLRSDGNTVGNIETTPWCGDFVQTSIALSLPDEILPTNPYLALNWKKFGLATKPAYGAVCSMWRGNPNSWKGHVGFIVGVNQDGSAYRILGGNQGNRVSEVWIGTYRARQNGIRWPETALPPTRGLPVLDSSGAVLSTNEA